MSTAQLQRLAVGLVVAGAVMVAWCLLAGQRSLTPSWDAARSVASVFALVWLWAATPRLTFEDACERAE